MTQIETRWQDRREMVHDLLDADGYLAEIGVAAGDFSRHLLHTCPRRLYLVDTWAGLGFWNGNLIAHEGHLVRVLERYAGRPEVTICRANSHWWLKNCRPGELDAVYIDADHRRPAVACDLEAAWQAVRPGGWIMGHDWTTDPRVLPGVREAVTAFAADYSLPTIWLTDERPAGVYFGAELADYRCAYNSFAFQRTA